MTRCLVLSGGVGHPFAATSGELSAILGAAGITAEVDEDLERGVRRLAEPGAFGLVAVNALRWRMLGDRYEAQRASWAFSLSPEARSVLEGFVAAGGPLLAVHTASICFDDWPEWGRIVGAAWNWDRSSHPPLGTVYAAVHPGAHPIVEGIDDFEVVDEAYGFLDLQPDVRPLLSATHGGREHPLLWARHYGAGRVVYSGLGHDERSYAHPVHRTIVRRAAEWLVSPTPGRSERQ